MPLVWLSAYNSILALTLHLQLHKKSFYLRNRIQFLVAMRYIRLLGVILLVDRSIPDMLRIQETSCGYTIFKVLLYRIGYILTTFVGYQVPLKHQIWVIMLNLVVMSVLSIQQCKQANPALSALLECPASMGEYVAITLGKLAPFSSNFESSPPIEPWQACARFQVLLIVSIYCIFFQPIYFA